MSLAESQQKGGKLSLKLLAALRFSWNLANLTAKLMVMFIANEYFFPQESLETFCFDQMGRGYKPNFIFWSTWLIRQKGETKTVIFLTKFVALHLCPDWIGLTSMQCIVEHGVRDDL